MGDHVSFSAIIIGPGPGSPDLPEDIGVMKDIWKLPECDLLPIFGVCLGFQSLVIEHGGQLRRLQVVKHGQVSQILHNEKDIFENLPQVTAVRYHSYRAEPHSNQIEPLAWADDGVENGSILMAGRHRTRPFWGVRYHPESVLTDEGGLHILRNFWALAVEWSRKRGRCLYPLEPSAMEILGLTYNPHHHPRLRRLLHLESRKIFIIASLLPTSLQILYSVGDVSVTLKSAKSVWHETLDGYDVWSWISRFMRLSKARDGTLSYELGVDSLGVPLRRNRRDMNAHPDINLIYVQRSLVLNTLTNKVYIQSLLPDDSEWMANISDELKKLPSSSLPSRASLNMQSASALVALPDRSRYIVKIESTQDFLRSGDSYKLLRQCNPAPYSAYLRLQPLTFLSSSPERFISYSRSPNTLCQLKPIKDTLHKAPGVTRAYAEEALRGSRKEVAENLMIVDLIRHDLHSMVGLDVYVKQFCQIEEYDNGHLPAGSQRDDLGWEVLRQSLPPGNVVILQNLEDEHRLYSGI
ncbi:MAG: ADC synthase [Lentinula lateritia]|nr:MAG: ADC synthase [Lentinula lateritia]